LVPAEGVADEGKGLAPHHVEEAPWVEAGQVAAVRAPPPVDEAQVGLAVPDAVVVLVDHLAGVVGVVGCVRVRHPLAPENVTAAVVVTASSLSGAGSARQQRLGGEWKKVPSVWEAEIHVPSYETCQDQEKGHDEASAAAALLLGVIGGVEKRPHGTLDYTHLI